MLNILFCCLDHKLKFAEERTKIQSYLDLKTSYLFNTLLFLIFSCVSLFFLYDKDKDDFYAVILFYVISNILILFCGLKASIKVDKNFKPRRNMAGLIPEKIIIFYSSIFKLNVLFMSFIFLGLFVSFLLNYLHGMDINYIYIYIVFTRIMCPVYIIWIIATLMYMEA